MADIIIVPVQPGYDWTFRSPEGVVGRDLHRRGKRVETAAQRQAGSRRGTLRRDITTEWTNTSGDILTIRVGSSNVPHALMHHQGTRPHVIFPVHGKVLRFVNKAGNVVFAKVVHSPGTRGNHYLTDNLKLAVI